MLQPTDLLAPRGTSTQALAINDLGQIAGEEETSYGVVERYYVIWTNGVPTKLPTPAGYHIDPNTIESGFTIDINNEGQLLASVNNYTSYFPVVWTGGIPVVLAGSPNDCLATSAFNSFGLRINNRGHVLGYSLGYAVGDPNCNTAVYWIWDGTQYRRLSLPQNPDCPSYLSAIDLNDKDEILGYRACNGTEPAIFFVHSDGSYTFYRIPSDVTLYQAGTINNAGENIATGNSTTGERVFLYWRDPSQPPTVGTSPSGTLLVGVGRINQVGAFVLTAGIRGTSPAQNVAYLYRGATFRKLLPPVDFFGLPAVNDFGQVVAIRTVGGIGQERGFWYIPQGMEAPF